MQTYITPFRNASVHFSKVTVTVNVCYEGKKAYALKQLTKTTKIQK